MKNFFSILLGVLLFISGLAIAIMTSYTILGLFLGIAMMIIGIAIPYKVLTGARLP